MSIVEKALKRLQQQHVAARDTSAVKKSELGDPPKSAVTRPQANAAPVSVPNSRGRVTPTGIVELRNAGMLPSPSQERRLANEYRQVKRRLLANAFGRGVERLPKGAIMVVASAIPGEGKTFTSINLAMSLAAEHDVSVVLVDADVAKPHISKLFGVDKEQGLLDALLEERVSVESSLFETPVARLSVLPVGHSDVKSAAELVVSARMEQLMTRLAGEYPGRLVVIDSAPILATSEARALVNVAGQIVLVVKAESTPQQAVLDALEYLDERKFVGVVLNQGPASSLDEFYGYGANSDHETKKFAAR